jgi:hypothetical protein
VERLAVGCVRFLYNHLMRYPLGGLSIVAALNLFIFGVLSAVTVAGSTSFWPLIDCISLGQATVLGAVAALLPKRRFVGLAWLAIFAVPHAGTIWMIQHRFDVESWPMRFALFYDAFALAVAAVLMGFRFVGGWRLSFDGMEAMHRAGQYSLGQLVELTTCIAALLGCFSALRQADMGLSLIDVAIIFPWPILIIIPALRVVFARPVPTFTAGLLLTVWVIGVCFASWMTDLRYVRFIALLATWELSLKYTVVFLTALFGNLFVLRWLGVRWYAPTKQRWSPA